MSASQRPEASADAVGRLLGLITERGCRGMTVGQLVARLVAETSVSRSTARQRLRPVLRQLEQEGKIVAGRGKRYLAVSSAELLTGRLQRPAGAGGGDATVQPDPDQSSGEPILIPRRGLRGAMAGDRVLVRLERRRRRARGEDRQQGVVVRILERRHAELVGRWVATGGRSLVRPLDGKLAVAVTPVVSHLTEEPADGELVVVATEAGPDRRGHLRGTLLERLGRVDEPGVVEQAVLRLHGIDREIDADAETEAERLPETFTAHDLQGRWDLRERPAITIDPATARDFDDAVNAFAASSGDDIVVEVHIADVSHVVRPGTTLDRMARRRATSVYLPGLCVPMLPHRVSSELCCLRPGVDRLTYTVRFVVGGDGTVTRFEAHDSVIRSRRRCSYDEVFSWLSQPDETWPEETAPFTGSLRLLAEAARRLGQARRRRGSLDLDLSEPEVVLDSEGWVVSIRPAARNQAHRLIEELMVAANECVARMLMVNEQPALHRVHDPPSATRIEELQRLLGELGHVLPGDPRDLPPASLQQVLETINGRPEERLLATLILRSLARAVYSPDPRGHYALATSAYLHFTSPIRRYPDLICHRMLRRLQGEGPLAEPQRSEQEAELSQLAAACSAAEQRAEEAERAAIQWKTVLFLRDRLGDVFAGNISGVTDFGLFVQLDQYFIDGLVHISDLVDDFYLFEERNHRLLGQRTRRTWRLGDAVEVRLVSVDIEAMQLRLVPVGIVPDRRRLATSSRSWRGSR